MSCNGSCFEQEAGDYNLPFYKKREGSTCDCTLKKCPYYIFCRNELPEVLADYYGGNCLLCDIAKHLAKSENQEYTVKPTESEEECRVCMEMRILYKLPTCDHLFCLECYRNMYFTDYGKLEDYPPYPQIPCYCTGYMDDGNKDGKGICDVDDEYCCTRMKDFMENEHDHKWAYDDAMLEYIAARDAHNEFCEAYIKPHHLSECPLCRKHTF